VGRHNALDKLIGALLKARTSMTQGFVCITSRASFEMVQKTVKAGAGVLTAVSAPTRLAVDLAQQHNLVLAGLVRGQSFTAYSHPSRLTTPQPIALQA
jgi:FdhD protein